VAVKITYFHPGNAPDVDNIIKPIQDALNGVVYTDDNQVVSTACALKSVNGTFRVKGMSAEVAKGFVSGRDFVWIRILTPDDPQDLE
jgi:Holliday junction resolvase RusA-like endonuclease